MEAVPFCLLLPCLGLLASWVDELHREAVAVCAREDAGPFGHMLVNIDILITNYSVK